MQQRTKTLPIIARKRGVHQRRVEPFHEGGEQPAITGGWLDDGGAESRELSDRTLHLRGIRSQPSIARPLQPIAPHQNPRAKGCARTIAMLSWSTTSRAARSMYSRITPTRSPTSGSAEPRGAPQKLSYGVSGVRPTCNEVWDRK
jgi:hypothetical protein